MNLKTFSFTLLAVLAMSGAASGQQIAATDFSGRTGQPAGIDLQKATRGG